MIKGWWRNLVEAPGRNLPLTQREILVRLFIPSPSQLPESQLWLGNTFRMSLTWECAGISKITRSPWEMLHMKHSLHTPAIWSFAAVVGDDAIPRHIRPLCLQALLMEGGNRGRRVHASAATFHNPTSQCKISLTAALKEDGGLCLKGRDTFLNTVKGGYVTSKQIISSNLFFLLPAFLFYLQQTD